MLKLRHRNHDDDTDRRGRDVNDDRRIERSSVITDDEPTIIDRDGVVDRDRDGTVDRDGVFDHDRDGAADRDRDAVLDDDRELVVDRDRAGDRGTDDRTIVRERRPAVAQTYTESTELPPPPDEAGVRVEQVVTKTTFSPGQLVIMLAGAVSLALGIAAMVKGGLEGSMTDPVVQVFGFSHTPALGLIEAGAGVILMLTALHPALRPLAGLVGALMVAGGVVVLAEIDWVQQNLGAEQGFGWVPIALGGAAMLGAFALPTTTRRRVTVVR